MPAAMAPGATFGQPPKWASPGPGFTSPTGWYVVKSSKGTVGLVNHTTAGAIRLGAGNGTVLEAVPILLERTAQHSILYVTSTYGRQILDALQRVGANGDQAQALVGQLDAGAGKDTRLHQLLVDISGKPASVTAGVSTTLSGDAASAGVSIPGLSGLGALFGDIHTWVRIGEALLGVVLLALGVRALAGGA